MLGLEGGAWRRAGRNYWAVARARPVGCLFTLVELAGLPLIVIGLENHDQIVTIVGFVLGLLFVLDMAIATPARLARRERKRREKRDHDPS